MTSHIGKLPISIPQGTTVTISGSSVSIKGPKGEFSYNVPACLKVQEQDSTLVIEPLNEERETFALQGLARALLNSYVEGVSKGFEKKLEIVGVGYRVTAKGPNLEFALGYSHPVVVEAPQGITLTVVDPTHITVSGSDKQKVGEVSAQIRKLRPPEPYKGKGIRYAGEYVRRKAGKAGS